ncbi:DUF697 domain-containing protein [Nitratidesulfovibrio sp. D1]|uniref:DUF697 domain-containing protein n=1 Tax=Nitratidesulfovibrio sp. D1 TaxID=3440151 RepID=UPI003EBDE9E6
MHQLVPRALFLLVAALCASLFVFIGGQVLTLSDMAARIHPLLGQTVFWGGMAAYLAALGWLAASWFLRPRPLAQPQNPTPEELRDYLYRLTARLRANPHLREGGMAHPMTDAADMAAAAPRTPGLPGTTDGVAEAAALLRLLDAAALRETKRTASRIFLSTAVARNGRLDTLIVLVLLARLVWRVSSIYDQRPHPRDMVRLYINVAGTALAAGALEEAGLEEHIHALLGPLLTASPLASVPGASHVGTLLAAALVDGSANALLALRVGIVTRNMLSPVLPGCPARQNPYRESAALLGRMTAGLVRAVTKAAVGGVASGIRSGLEGTARRTADAVRKGARATAHGVGDVVHRAGDMATSVARAMPFRADAPQGRNGAPHGQDEVNDGDDVIPAAPGDTSKSSRPARIPNPLRLFRKKDS